MQDHPYEKFEHTALWKVLEESINDLVNKNDLVEKTTRNYIVGYLVKRVEESEDILKNTAID